MLVLLVYSNMRKWFAKNDHDATRVKQRLSYEYFIQNMHDTVTISFAGVLTFLRKMKNESLSFRKKIREKVYHFFNDDPLKINKWCKFLGFRIYKKKVKPLHSVKKSQQFSSDFLLQNNQMLQQQVWSKQKLSQSSSFNSFSKILYFVPSFTKFITTAKALSTKKDQRNNDIKLLTLSAYNQLPPETAIKTNIFTFMTSICFPIISILSFNSIDKLYHKGVKNG